jgi:hypothetical protein
MRQPDVALRCPPIEPSRRATTEVAEQSNPAAPGPDTTLRAFRGSFARRVAQGDAIVRAARRFGKRKSTACPGQQAAIANDSCHARDPTAPTGLSPRFRDPPPTPASYGPSTERLRGVQTSETLRTQVPLRRFVAPSLPVTLFSNHAFLVAKTPMPL